MPKKLKNYVLGVFSLLLSTPLYHAYFPHPSVEFWKKLPRATGLIQSVPQQRRVIMDVIPAK